ncbi:MULTISPECIES: hypothetical protein [Streptomyces]|uniref:Uncharacterized protein n=1 Tax=Streptomyces virginiae TaxID=1961 RepID=A0ABZ1T518_STRVG|nr:hypothetical protein [Streptomyces virginiae]
MDPDEIAITARAFDLSEGLASIRPMARARLMAKRLEPHRSLAPVGALLERAKGWRVARVIRSRYSARPASIVNAMTSGES